MRFVIARFYELQFLSISSFNRYTIGKALAFGEEHFVDSDISY